MTLFMIGCRIMLVFEWYYISVYRVSSLFVCNKRSGRRGIALIVSSFFVYELMVSSFHDRLSYCVGNLMILYTCL